MIIKILSFVLSKWFLHFLKSGKKCTLRFLLNGEEEKAYLFTVVKEYMDRDEFPFYYMKICGLKRFLFGNNRPVSV